MRFTKLVGLRIGTTRRRLSPAAGPEPSSAAHHSQSWGDLQRREFHEALLDAGGFEDLPGRWQAAIVAAEQERPKLRVVTSD